MVLMGLTSTRFRNVVSLFLFIYINHVAHTRSSFDRMNFTLVDRNIKFLVEVKTSICTVWTRCLAMHPIISSCWTTQQPNRTFFQLLVADYLNSMLSLCSVIDNLVLYPNIKNFFLIISIQANDIPLPLEILSLWYCISPKWLFCHPTRYFAY